MRLRPTPRARGAMISCLIIGLFWTSPSQAEAPRKLRIGAKTFTESKILAYMLWHLAREAGANPELPLNVVGNEIIWDMLNKGDLDAYVDYDGTIERLQKTTVLPDGIGSIPLAFENNYKVGVKQKSGLEKISDLKGKSGRLELSAGFHRRLWPKMKQRYKLNNIEGVEWDPVKHPMYKNAVERVIAGEILGTDVYSTDPIAGQLKLLEDDLKILGTYKAMIVYRKDRVKGSVLNAFKRLSGRISEGDIRKEIAKVDSGSSLESQVAEKYLRDNQILIGVAFTLWLRRKKENLPEPEIES